jgi:sigma-E factor negative regulatory protein RseA
LPSGLTSPINTRTVALQSGYETRPQENRRVVFQPRQPVSAATLVSDEEVTRYVNQMIQAHSDNAAMNAGQGVLPYARVIMTDEE